MGEVLTKIWGVVLTLIRTFWCYFCWAELGAIPVQENTHGFQHKFWLKIQMYFTALAL